MDNDLKQLLIDCANFIQPYDDGGNRATGLMARQDEALEEGQNLPIHDVTCFVCKKEGATSKEKIYDQCPECLGLGHSGYEGKYCGRCKGDGSTWVEVTVHNDCI